MSLLELFNGMNIAYALTGAVFFGGAGVVMFAFGISYISQKVAMWVDVRKLVINRNALVEEVKALRVQIQTLESINGKQGNDVIAPTEIGVKSVFEAPIKDNNK